MFLICLCARLAFGMSPPSDPGLRGLFDAMMRIRPDGFEAAAEIIEEFAAVGMDGDKLSTDAWEFVQILTNDLNGAPGIQPVFTLYSSEANFRLVQRIFDLVGIQESGFVFRYDLSGISQRIFSRIFCLLFLADGIFDLSYLIGFCSEEKHTEYCDSLLAEGLDLLYDLRSVEGLPLAGILKFLFGPDSRLYDGFPFERFFEGLDESLVSSRIKSIHDLARNQNEFADGLKARGHQADAETYYDVKMRVLRYFKLRIQADKRNAFSVCVDSVWPILYDEIDSLTADFKKPSVRNVGKVVEMRDGTYYSTTFGVVVEWRIIKFLLLDWGARDENLMAVVAEMDAELASLMTFWSFSDFFKLSFVRSDSPETFFERMLFRLGVFYRTIRFSLRSSDLRGYYSHYIALDDDAYLAAKTSAKPTLEYPDEEEGFGRGLMLMFSKAKVISDSLLAKGVDLPAFV